ncbi:MAG: hypothetical protein IH934_05300 [Nanoarchaeota archaeon]|nr:hypothetical protein [Nanoarchaeota archaeon]
MKKINNKYYGMIALIVSFFVLLLFLLLGLILSIFFIQNLFMGISGFGLMQILFFIIGLYLIYKPVMYIKFLIKNKNKFNEIFNKFIQENKKTIIITTILSIVLLFLFYSNISTNFDFFVNAVLYLPIFLLNNLVFIVNIFLLRYNLMFLTPLISLILPISEILFLFEVSRFISKFFKSKR